jgi:PIN domain nuclease of toxin-antitoxin system
MTVLDTHIWVWLVNESPELSSGKRQILASRQADGLGVSIISCWEIAKLVEKGRLALAVPVGQWIDQALAYPGIGLLPLDPRIAVASTQLPLPFHNDPADQIITATAREMDCPLATDDGKMLAYAHVKLAWPR